MLSKENNFDSGNMVLEDSETPRVYIEILNAP